MKKVYQTALFATLLAVCLTGCNGSKKRGGGGGGGGGDVYSKYYKNQLDFNGNKVDDYHLKDTTGEELQKQIHHYLIDQHKTYLHYSSIAKYYLKTDRLDETGVYECFYTAYNNNLNVTREHIWCCANSNGMWYRSSKELEWHMDDKKEQGEKENYWGGGSDIFQLRPSTYEVNSARSNYKYTVFEDSNYESITDEGAPYSLKYNNSKKLCEVDDYFKGDVARTLMYIYMHYNSFDNYDVYYSKEFTPTYDFNNAVEKVAGSHTPYVCGPDRNDGSKWLQFNLIMDYNESQCIRLLKEWNRIDPPSALEKQRNNYICEKVQGNRNPFIDFPELVDKCFPDVN